MGVYKLFWDDPYATTCDAIVTGAIGDVVTLDRTVAFARSGGQASDRGRIAGHEILAAEPEGPEILYTLATDHGLTPGQLVGVEIDWENRFRLMRLHMAAEIVLELINQGYGAPRKTGADITSDKARLDFEWAGNISEVFPDITPMLSHIVECDLPIWSRFEDRDRQRRSWEIAGFARVACGGTHPRSTGEIGGVELKRVNPGAGVERIEIRLEGE